MKKHRVVVTGLGVVSCLGNDLETFESALREGRSGIKHVPKLEELGFRCQVAGIPDGTDQIAENLFEEEELLDMDSVNRYGCIAAARAWLDAGFQMPKESEIDWGAGAVIGSETAGLHTVAEKLYPLVEARKVRRLGSRYVEQTMIAGVASRIAYFLGLGNKVVSVNATSSTGLAAVLDGYRHIQAGLADRMLCGGAESSSPYAWAGLDSMRVLANGREEPEEASRPMSSSASGFVPSAGAGVVLLENADVAMRRGARIYAEIEGANMNCGARRDGGSMTAPSAEGIQYCIYDAINESELICGEIDLINGHLTSTFADPLEFKNWIKVFGKNLPYIHSTKSLMGHAIIAAGGIEMVACCLMLRGGFIHPSLNCEDIHQDIAPYEENIPRETIEKPINNIIKANFGFGDVNTCVVLRKW